MLATRAAAAPCAGEGVLTIIADNESGADDVALVVSGERLDTGDACDPGGTGLQTARGRIAKNGHVMLEIHLNPRGRALLAVAKQLPVLLQTTIRERHGTTHTTTDPAMLVGSPKKPRHRPHRR
jgi:hypothetical protein